MKSGIVHLITILLSFLSLPKTCVILCIIPSSRGCLEPAFKNIRAGCCTKFFPALKRHVSYEGSSEFEYWPYFELQEEPFSCFPELTE